MKRKMRIRSYGVCVRKEKGKEAERTRESYSNQIKMSWRNRSTQVLRW